MNLDQAAQGFVQRALDSLQEQRFHSLSGQSVPVLNYIFIVIYFFFFFLLWNWKLHTSVQDISLVLPPRICYQASSPHLFCRLNKHSSLSLLSHLVGCPLDSLKFINTLVLGGPKPDTVFHTQSNKCQIMENNHFHPPIGQGPIGITQDTVSLQHCQGTQLARLDSCQPTPRSINSK